jgi:hypothetical protein
VGARSCAALALSLALGSGCGQSVIVGLDDALGGGGTASGAGSGGGGELITAGVGNSPALGDAGAAGCTRVACRGKYYECGDCIDNDGDGQIDERDGACLGPCDDDELGLSSGLKLGGGAPCSEDCYFDGDSGSGDDMCSWSYTCDPLSVAPDYPPSGEMRCEFGAKISGGQVDCAALASAQPQACLEHCLPLVPNGCDCFGCCELPARSGEYHYIGKGRGSLGCRLDALGDPSSCPLCTPVKACFNQCEPCEACVGGEPDPSCSATVACERGSACGPGVPCPAEEYCVTGCCVEVPR